MHLCDGKEPQGLQDQGKAFVQVVWKLLERLLVYRRIIQDEIKEHRMSCIVNLLVRLKMIVYLCWAGMAQLVVCWACCPAVS